MREKVPRERARKRSVAARYRKRRRRLAAALLGAMVLALAALAWERAELPGGSPAQKVAGKPSALEQKPSAKRESPAKPASTPAKVPTGARFTLAGDAYQSIAGGLPGAGLGKVEYVQESVLDPSWASVRFPAPPSADDGPGQTVSNERYYALFLHREGGSWKTVRSVLIDDWADRPKNVVTLLPEVPKDLLTPLFPPADAPPPQASPGGRAQQVLAAATGKSDWQTTASKGEGDFYRVGVRERSSGAATEVYLRTLSGVLEPVAVGRGITSAEAPGFPKGLVEPAKALPEGSYRKSPAKPVYDLKSKSEAPKKEQVRRGMNEALGAVKSYPGVVGFYAVDLKSGEGYGVRPDEEFFTASTIKVAVLAAVYRRIGEGKLKYSTPITTTSSDWASGAGGLQWQTPGAKTTVEDALWLMITQSDNVATNALIRMVGGPSYVNGVARSLGAKHTALVWKLNSERAAVPMQDNYSTPRDMAAILKSIYEGKGFSSYASHEMVDLLEHNNLEYWMEAGVPQGVKVADKGGWLETTYDDVGIVEYKDHPYVLAIFTKYGRGMTEGETTLAEVSKAVWLAESGESKEQYEKSRKS